MGLRKIISHALPDSVKDRLRTIRNRWIVHIFSRNRLLSSLYYFLFSTQFRREHKSVLSGIVAYDQSLQDIGESCVLLRRNVHRLEKGLIMRPRRPVFAESYIKETVDCYEQAMKAGTLCESEQKWFDDVLTEYFSIVSDTPRIKPLREKFAGAAFHAPDKARTSLPYKYKDLKPSQVNFDQLHSLCVKRRSVRWFEDKSVPIALIRQATNIATLAPSACNRQPYYFYTATEKEKAVEIARCAGGATGFAENIPCIIVVVGDLSAYFHERDRHTIYIDASLAAMLLMLALETLGLSSCTLNWPDVEQNEAKLQKILGLKDYQRPIILLAIGYADPEGGIPYSQKKSDEILVKEV